MPHVSSRLAFFTLGVLKEPVGAAAVQGFVDRLAAVYTRADGSDGFFARSIRDVETWEHSWGPVVVPACAPQGLPPTQIAMTLSLWRDLESVVGFSYAGEHGEALSRRAEWFQRGPWPGFVAWWVDADHRPNWAEAVERIDRLHAEGPTPTAFNFRQPFDAAGTPTKLKRPRAQP